MRQTVSPAGNGSRVKRYGMLFLALLSVAGAVWRALAALHHLEFPRMPDPGEYGILFAGFLTNSTCIPTVSW